MEKWNGFDCEALTFEGYEAQIVFPKAGTACGGLAVKTEYRDAFPETECRLLELGFHLCYIRNRNRWGTDDDLDRKARFIRYVTARHHLKAKCALVGMSCGGLIAVKLAARYPELVSCLYLDAPVINYMSCPCGFGVGEPLNPDLSEILDALGLDSVSRLLAYRDMPLDHLNDLTRNRIPIVLVAGDADHVVPFCENGIFVQEACKNAGTEIEVYLKPGCDHHPHGLADPAPITDFILRHTCPKGEER